MKTLLLTGGTGYIGSHNAVLFLQEGYDVIILDNLSNSSEDVLEKIETIVNTPPVTSGHPPLLGGTKKKSSFVEGGGRRSEGVGKLSFYKGDLRNREDIETVFSENTIDAVIHFAGLKAVGESCEMPHEYYENNVVGTLNLTKVMQEHNCRDMIFSSSATVYDPSELPPFSETSLTGNTTNPYGTSKFIIENILRDLTTHKDFRVVNLRYFNPVGAHSSGLIGENPSETPNNLLPYIMKVATGELSSLNVYGDDYDTKDGTGVRDYIHVEDLAAGHLASLEWLQSHTPPQSSSIEGEASASEQGESKGVGMFEIINLGTGHGTSVMEMIAITEQVIGKALAYSIVARRPGDIASAYCNPQKAEKLLGWKAEKSLQAAVADSWKFITIAQGK